MNLVNVVSEILKRDVTIEEAKDFAFNQYGLLTTYLYQTDKLKAKLKEKGYYTDNLWHVNDVVADLPIETKQIILDKILNDDTLKSEINSSISNELNYNYEIDFID